MTEKTEEKKDLRYKDYPTLSSLTNSDAQARRWADLYLLVEERVQRQELMRSGGGESKYLRFLRAACVLENARAPEFLIQDILDYINRRDFDLSRPDGFFQELRFTVDLFLEVARDEWVEMCLGPAMMHAPFVGPGKSDGICSILMEDPGVLHDEGSSWYTRHPDFYLILELLRNYLTYLVRGTGRNNRVHAMGYYAYEPEGRKALIRRSLSPVKPPESEEDQ